jgi:hypothetical protein
MAMTNQEKRTRLFKVMAQDLSDFFPEARDTVCCPYCFTGLEIGDCSNGRATFAHAWPEALGGKVATLACSTCNGRTNEDFDNQLVRLSRFNRAILGQGVPVRLRFPDGEEENATSVWLQLRLKPEMPELTVSFNPGHCNPFVADKLFGRLKQRVPKFTFDFEITEERRVLLALLNSAYLAMCHTFGYEWVFSRCGQIVRHQLRNPKQSLFTTVATAYSMQRKPSGASILLVRISTGQAGFIVCFPDSPQPPYNSTFISLPLFNGSPIDWSFLDPDASPEILMVWPLSQAALQRKQCNMPGHAILFNLGLIAHPEMRFFCIQENGDPVPEVFDQDPAH